MNALRISADEYLAIKGKLTTIDLRTEAEIESEHIKGCLPLPVQQLSKAKFEQVLSSQPSAGSDVYLLCQSGRRAEIAIEKLSGLEGHKLIIIEGGFNALKTAGASTIQSSRRSISLERQVRIAAGALTLSGVFLGFSVHTLFFGLSAFVGAGLMFAGITDTCGMALMLAQMPWNKSAKA